MWWFSTGHHVNILYIHYIFIYIYVYIYTLINIFGWYWLSFGVPLYVSTLIAFLQFQLLSFCTFFSCEIFVHARIIQRSRNYSKQADDFKLKKMLYFFNFLHSEIMADQSRTRTPPVNLVEKTRLVQQKRYIFI